MSEQDHWLKVFAARHESAESPAVYWLSLLSLLVGTVGILWSLPVPGEFLRISPIMNWGSTFLMAAAVYYFIISVALGFGMVPFILALGALEAWLADQPMTPGYISSVLIGAGISGLCYGHYAQGGFRAVLRDVQLVMIAPVWLLSNAYRRLGIPF